MAELTWHGHSCFTLVTDEGTRILLDPFLDHNPKADVKADQIDKVDFILCSHGHGDHFSDCVPIARRTGATVISTYELANFVKEQGAQAGHGLNIGGAYEFPFGRVKLTTALHSGTLLGTTATDCCGFLINLRGGQRVYFAGDTALTMDMQLLKGQVDVALLPIGDNFTMGPEDAARAVEFIQPRVVIPMHYDTFEMIAQDPEAFRTRVGKTAEVQIMKPGSTYRF